MNQAIQQLLGCYELGFKQSRTFVGQEARPLNTFSLATWQLPKFSLHEGSPLIADGEHDDPHYDHRQREELTHRERSEDETKLSIRLAKEFYDYPAESIPSDEAPEDGAWWRCGFRDDP